MDNFIDQSKKLEELLRTSERKFATMFESAPFAICLVQMPHTTIVDVNPAFIKLFGFTKEELIGKSSVNIGMHEDAEARARVVDEFARFGKVRGLETKILTKDGRHLIISNFLDSIEFEGNTYVLGTYQDVTEKRKAEDDLKEALEARDQFLSIASHELKTPLTALKLQAQLHNRLVLKGSEEAYSKSKIDRFYLQLDKNVSQLVALVDDMLDISRIQMGSFTIHRESVDVVSICKDVIQRIQIFLPEKKKDLVKFSAPKELKASLDPIKYGQVLSNLLQNSIKYGQGKAIEVVLSDSKDSVNLVVQDEGIGIAKENQDRIFKPYERLVNASEVSGLGLGLFICHKIVEAHSGSISVKSDLGSGATFSVAIPKALT